MTFTIGASAIWFAAFHGSGDQGGSYDVGQVKFRYCCQDFLPADKEILCGFRLKRAANLISSIHAKIIS